MIEGFDDASVDTKLWRIWHSNPDRVSFAVRDGQFIIRARNQIGHNGLWQLEGLYPDDVYDLIVE